LPAKLINLEIRKKKKKKRRRRRRFNAFVGYLLWKNIGWLRSYLFLHFINILKNFEFIFIFFFSVN